MPVSGPKPSTWALTTCSPNPSTNPKSAASCITPARAVLLSPKPPPYNGLPRQSSFPGGAPSGPIPLVGAGFSTFSAVNRISQTASLPARTPPPALPLSPLSPRSCIPTAGVAAASGQQPTGQRQKPQQTSSRRRRTLEFQRHDSILNWEGSGTAGKLLNQTVHRGPNT